MGYINVRAESWVQRAKSTECDWSISVSGCGSRGERSVHGGAELVFGLGGPWTQILSLFHSCRSAPLPLFSVAILTFRASPAPRLPNEEWHASAGSDLVSNRDPASSVLSPIIDLGGSRCAALMRAPHTQEASLLNPRGSSKAACNCTEWPGPNCLYSWAEWLILGENEQSNCLLIWRISNRPHSWTLYVCVCVCTTGWDIKLTTPKGHLCSALPTYHLK